MLTVNRLKTYGLILRNYLCATLCITGLTQGGMTMKRRLGWNGFVFLLVLVVTAGSPSAFAKGTVSVNVDSSSQAEPKIFVVTHDSEGNRASTLVVPGAGPADVPDDAELVIESAGAGTTVELSGDPEVTVSDGAGEVEMVQVGEGNPIIATSSGVTTLAEGSSIKLVTDPSSGRISAEPVQSKTAEKTPSSETPESVHAQPKQTASAAPVRSEATPPARVGTVPTGYQPSQEDMKLLKSVSASPAGTPVSSQYANTFSQNPRPATANPGDPLTMRGGAEAARQMGTAMLPTAGFSPSGTAPAMPQTGVADKNYGAMPMTTMTTGSQGAGTPQTYQPMAPAGSSYFSTTGALQPVTGQTSQTNMAPMFPSTFGGTPTSDSATNVFTQSTASYMPTMTTADTTMTAGTADPFAAASTAFPTTTDTMTTSALTLATTGATSTTDLASATTTMSTAEAFVADVASTTTTSTTTTATTTTTTPEASPST